MQLQNGVEATRERVTALRTRKFRHTAAYPSPVPHPHPRMLTRERTSGRKPVSLFEMISVISSTESRRSSQLLQACRALLIEQVELMTQFVTCGMWHTGSTSLPRTAPRNRNDAKPACSVPQGLGDSHIPKKGCSGVRLPKCSQESSIFSAVRNKISGR